MLDKKSIQRAAWVALAVDVLILPAFDLEINIAGLTVCAIIGFVLALAVQFTFSYPPFRVAKACTGLLTSGWAPDVLPHAACILF